jgi:hypothetical protein
LRKLESSSFHISERSFFTSIWCCEQGSKVHVAQAETYIELWPVPVGFRKDVLADLHT